MVRHSNPSIVARRIVSLPRGSWRWQDAYAVAEYRPRRTKDGRIVWASAGHVTGKMSMPQLRRMGLDGLKTGSLHHKPYAGVVA